jgi:hypothetical protein
MMYEVWRLKQANDARKFNSIVKNMKRLFWTLVFGIDFVFFGIVIARVIAWIK